MKKLRSLIQKIKIKNPHVRIGIWGVNITNNKKIAINSDEVFGTASLIKVPIAFTLFRLFEQKKIDIDKQFSLDGFKIFDKGQRDSGILKFLPRNASVTLRFLCSLMLSLSDNAATNIILEYITKEQINSCMKMIGLRKTKITIRTINPIKLEKEKNMLGVTTPKEMTRLFQLLGNGNEIRTMLQSAHAITPISRHISSEKNVKDAFVSVKHLFGKGGVFPELLVNVQTVGIELQNNSKIYVSIFTEGIDDKKLRSVAINHPSHIFIAKALHIIIKELQ